MGKLVVSEMLLTSEGSPSLDGLHREKAYGWTARTPLRFFSRSCDRRSSLAASSRSDDRGGGVRLGGPSTYAGVFVQKPFIGEIRAKDYRTAAEQSLCVVAVAAGMGVLAAVFLMRW